MVRCGAMWGPAVCQDEWHCLNRVVTLADLTLFQAGQTELAKFQRVLERVPSLITGLRLSSFAAPAPTIKLTAFSHLLFNTITRRKGSVV